MTPPRALHRIPPHESKSGIYFRPCPIFVVEQNHDAQLRGMLVIECGQDTAKLTPVLHYDGTPITARFISGAIAERLALLNVTPLKKVAQ